MRLLYYMGLALMAMACFAAVAEIASHALPGDKGEVFVSARDLWYTFRPKSLLIFEIRLNRLAPWLLDPYLLNLLKLPAWFILGAPGMGLIIKFRPPGEEDHDAEIRELHDSFELFDELTRQAKAEQADNDTTHEAHGPQDMLPDDLMGEDIAPDANRPDDFLPGANPYAENGDGEQK